jgi:small redox-active disulfide protein 2
MLKIQILGIGCNTCQHLEADVRELVLRKKIDAQVERVDDIEAILNYQLKALPGLVINDKVVACGYSGKGKLEHLIEDAICSLYHPGNREASHP